ncbi:S8 family peptidase [Priestia megaterium]|uniref:S8 family peptidase n=2 Tax=Priestia megaterium TaxID=1404 RepID=UPI002E1E964A|nr:S8 family serine peptidase [Priestia megaterium]MED4068420.1 S8 family serine peptidase [Priestia megaterium]
MNKIFTLVIFLMSLTVLQACTSEKSHNIEQVHNKENWEISDVILKKHEKSDYKIKIAVLDSGISKIDELKHSISYSYNALDNTKTTDDKYGHGTMIGSIIAAKNNENIGVNKQAEILDIQVLDDKGRGTVDSVTKGINKAIEEKADIINLSIGFSKDNIELKKAINNAVENGIIVVAAAGNNMGYQPDYPAKYHNVISVSSIDKKNKIYDYAAKGKIGVVAPGVKVPVINNKSKLKYESGTSFSAAYVSSILSLYLEDKKHVNLNFLNNHSKKIGDMKTYGVGLLLYK